ncbi:MAG TPA: carbamoyltransferase HypF [Chromatiales bacterium]|nr:carbamoyltransferase HypF [Chromatiales bacterium]
MQTHALRIRGLVQGVGFRPTVWRLANTFKLSGNVCNDGKGVLINCLADTETLNDFIQALHNNCPPLARIDSIEEVTPTDEIIKDDFQIIHSSETPVSTGITADAATCPACLRELNDSTDRRYRYPFLNCTHCGPRFSIVQQLPYDRKNTGMARFDLCPHCEHEYKNPADRRFHAQPTACAHCGPRLWLCDKNGKRLAENDALKQAAARIKQGEIIAIKGIGGVHLACDASNRQAIKCLRQRKQRPHKPLALMAKNLKQIAHYCAISPQEEQALSSPAAPIVLLDAVATDLLPSNIAPGQKQWGFMLPYSPLHHLLMAELEQPLVLTSGNHSDEPQCIDNDQTLIHLAEIADAFLLHDRPIENRIDDSVVRLMNNKIQVLRRARGYAPGHITLPAGFENHPPVLALGAELKSTFCLLQNGHAILSQHMGDLEDARTFDDYQKNLELYLTLYTHKTEILAADKHPEYLSSKLADKWHVQKNLPLIRVQHHHAHIAACMADNQIALDAGPVIGIAFDGLGFGDDGSLWGGEFLLADYCDYTRLAHLKPMALPGAAQAMREPWRNTWAQLEAAFGWQAFAETHAALALTQSLQQQPITTLQQMLQKNINSPLSSSAGRLFDAVAAATGLAPAQCSYEGQAAMALEASITQQDLSRVSPYPFTLHKQSHYYQLDPTPMWEKLLSELQANTGAGIIAAGFHRGLGQSIIDTACLLAKENNIRRVALSGGVFQNRTLFEQVVQGLQQKKLQVLTHRQVPANDGGIALGQAIIAAARQLRKKHYQEESLCV